MFPQLSPLPATLCMLGACSFLITFWKKPLCDVSGELQGDCDNMVKYAQPAASILCSLALIFMFFGMGAGGGGGYGGGYGGYY